MLRSIRGLAFKHLSPVFGHNALLHLFDAYTSLETGLEQLRNAYLMSPPGSKKNERSVSKELDFGGCYTL